MDPAAIAGAGLVIGAVFLILGITGVVSRLARESAVAPTPGVNESLSAGKFVLGANGLTLQSPQTIRGDGCPTPRQ